MSWFASKTMHEGNPAIVRMLRTLPKASAKDPRSKGEGDKEEEEEEGREPEGAAEAGGEKVYLFLREVGCYYTFCGGVTAAAWAPGSRPLRLEWELTRFDELLGSSPAFWELLGPVLGQQQQQEEEQQGEAPE